MAFIKAISGKCGICGKKFYAPFGHDQISNVAGSGEPRGVAFEGGRLGLDEFERTCSWCTRTLWDLGGPIWADKPSWWHRPEEGEPVGEAILLPVPSKDES